MKKTCPFFPDVEYWVICDDGTIYLRSGFGECEGKEWLNEERVIPYPCAAWVNGHCNRVGDIDKKCRRTSRLITRLTSKYLRRCENDCTRPGVKIMKGWDSTRMIGKVKESYKNYLDRPTRLHDDPLWNAFYNGWLEGRGDMLMQIERERKASLDQE